MPSNEAPVRATLDRLCLAFTAFLILWFCQDLVLGESVPFFRDLSTYFYPLRFSLFESFRSGKLPLWNRHMGMGFPVLADFQSGAFYPPHLLLLVLPFFTAIRVIFVLHFLIAGLGTYKLFRLWSYPYHLSIMAALLFTLGGTLVSLSNLLNHFQTAVWLPWILLFYEAAVRAISWKRFLALVLILAVQFLAGSPEFFVLTMLIIVIDAFRIKASEPAVRYGRMTLIFIGANLLVVGLVMVQLLPTAELFFESRRNQPIPTQEVLYWSLKPQNLLNLLFLDKEVDLSASVGMQFFFAREASFFVSNYLGAIWTFGICLYFYLASGREKLALLGLIIASLLLAFGSHTPVYPFLLRHIPMLSAVRFPEKFLYITYALFVYGGVKGLVELPNCDKVRFKKAIWVLGFLCLSWIGSYLYLRSNLVVVAQAITVNAGVYPSPAVYTKMVAAVVTNLERQIVLSLGLIFLFALVMTERIRRSLFAFLLVAVTFVDLSWAHRDFLFLLNPQFMYGSQRVLQEPDRERNRLFYYPTGQNLHPSFFAIQGQPRFKEAVALFFQNLLPNEGIFYGFDYFQEIDALARRPYTEFLGFANQLDFGRQIKLLRTFNVRYLVSFQPLPTTGVTLTAQFPQYFSWLYRIEGTVPRAYVVNQSIEEKDSAQVLQRLASVAFDPMQEVVLDEPAGITPQRELLATANIVRYENQAVTVHTSLNDAGILVLADSYYPGWKAYVDGREARILKANHFFRAVPLSAGTHTVEFRYEPRSFVIGRAISIVTLSLIVAVSMLLYMRKRRQKLTARAC